MGFFNDDPFEDIVREFFQESRQRTTSSGDLLKSEREERVVDYIEDGKKVYFVFEIFGYSKEDIKVNVGKGFVEVEANKKNFEGVQDYFVSKLGKKFHVRKTVPGMRVKNYDWTFKNGILEVEIEIK